MTTRVTVLHGPNLNLLGTREVETYGSATLDEIDDAIRAEATVLDQTVDIHQSNHEGALVDLIQAAADGADALVINAAGYTHTSVAIRDAIAAVGPKLWTVEVHLTIPSAREVFRHESLLAGVVTGRVEGFGGMSYLLALRAVSTLIASRGHARHQ